MNMHLQRIATLGASAIGLVAVFLPWGGIKIFGMSKSFSPLSLPSGVEFFGILVLFAFIGAGVLNVLGDKESELQKPNSYACMGAGAVALLSTIIEIVRFTSTYNLGLSAGAFISIIAAAAIIAVPFVLKPKA
jgi:hypothetical protein